MDLKSKHEREHVPQEEHFGSKDIIMNFKITTKQLTKNDKLTSQFVSFKENVKRI